VAAWEPAPVATAAISVFRDRLDFPQQCIAGIDGYDSYEDRRKTSKEKEKKKERAHRKTL